MSDLRIVIPGAAGRMGRMLVKAIHDTPGVALAAALEMQDSIALGQDAGLLAGVGTLGVPITVDPLVAFVRADAVIDFTVDIAIARLANLHDTRFELPLVRHGTGS